MTRTADDARYRPRPGDTRQYLWPSTPCTRCTVTRATDWAVEFRTDLDDVLFVVSLGDWSLRAPYDNTVWTPKQRTAEDARFDPLPGDTWRAGDVTCTVTARDGDYVDVEAQVDDRLKIHTDRWSVMFWSSDDGTAAWAVG